MRDNNDRGTNKGKETTQPASLHVIEEAISQIPEDYRMVFSLREINGLNVAETATLLNISEANVKCGSIARKQC